MKKLLLTKNQITLVDDEDFYKFKDCNWHCNTKNKKIYAARSIKKPKRKTIYLHREIMNAKPEEHVDHINGNTLDNRKQNLRICTNQENSFNQKKKSISKNKYKGVRKNKCNTWMARIRFNQKELYLGCFKTEVEAAKAYNKAATQYFGKFAFLNEVENA